MNSSQEQSNSIKALIISVGGTEEPLLKTIRHHQPEFVSFFASQATLGTAAKVKESARTGGLAIVGETTLVDNENDLMQCYEKAEEAVARVAARNYGKDQVMVDYTGATKNMSVALALAAINQGYAFSYVGGDKRTKEGVGIVETGHEKIYVSVNPWDFMAVEEKKQAALFFNSCQFKACRDLLNDLAVKATRRRSVFKKLAFVVDGFLNWDLFRHQDALESFRRGKLEELQEDMDRNIATFAASCESSKPVLETIISCSEKGKKPCSELAHDLFANAERRFTEGKVDDAILRLYRLVEMLAQCRLLEAYNIDAADVREEQIPAAIREELVKEHRNSRDGKIKVPQNALYALLLELHDPLGVQFKVNEPMFRNVQSARNSSYLAHGFNSSKEATYQKLRDFVFALGAVDLERVPVFPKLML